MIVISLINQKGGCGKSSTCFHLSGALAASGARVLLVDADPQGSLSQGFFGSSAIEGLSSRETLAALFDPDILTPAADSLIVYTSVPDVALLPANLTLAPWNMTRPESTGAQQYALSTLLETVTEFDYALIDCPPNLYQCSWNAMVASDFVIVPVPPEDYGTQGLRAVHQAIDQTRLLNSRLRRLGHLISRYDCRLAVHQAYETRLRQHYSDLMFETNIPEAAAFKVAVSSRLPVELVERKSKAAAAMRQVRDEILARISAKQLRRAA